VAGFRTVADARCQSTVGSISKIVDRLESAGLCAPQFQSRGDPGPHPRKGAAQATQRRPPAPRRIARDPALGLRYPPHARSRRLADTLADLRAAPPSHRNRPRDTSQPVGSPLIGGSQPAESGLRLARGRARNTNRPLLRPRRTTRPGRPPLPPRIRGVGGAAGVPRGKREPHPRALAARSRGHRRGGYGLWPSISMR